MDAAGAEINSDLARFGAAGRGRAFDGMAVLDLAGSGAVLGSGATLADADGRTASISIAFRSVHGIAEIAPWQRV